MTTMDPSAQEFHPESSGYPYVMQPQVVGMADFATMQMLEASKWGMPVMLAGLMGSSMMESQFTQAAPNKAMPIKSPKTGEVLNPETLKVERQTSQSSSTQDPSPQGEVSAVKDSADTKDTPSDKVKAFDARARAEFKATAALASSRLRSMKLRPDHSTFSALNVDTLPSKPKSSPLASTCEGGNIILRPCRPLKERPKTRISRPLPEVPGFPFDKVPASAAQMLAVLSLEPGTGKVSKKPAKTKAKSDVAALKSQPKLLDKEAKQASEQELSTTATDSRGSDLEQDPSSGSGEDSQASKSSKAQGMPLEEDMKGHHADPNDLKKDSASDDEDEDGKASAGRSTSATSLKEGLQASAKLRWADVESDDEECPWQSHQTQSKACQESPPERTTEASTKPAEEESDEEERHVSRGSFSKTRWADVDSDDDQLLPSDDDEEEDSDREKSRSDVKDLAQPAEESEEAEEEWQEVKKRERRPKPVKREVPRRQGGRARRGKEGSQQ